VCAPLSESVPSSLLDERAAQKPQKQRSAAVDVVIPPAAAQIGDELPGRPAAVPGVSSILALQLGALVKRLLAYLCGLASGRRSGAKEKQLGSIPRF